MFLHFGYFLQKGRVVNRKGVMASCTESEADGLFGLCGLVLAMWVNLEYNCAKLKPAAESIGD